MTEVKLSLPEGVGATDTTDHAEVSASAGVGPARQSGDPAVDPAGPRQVSLLPAQVEALSSGLRAYLQQHTFTAEECSEVSIRLLGSFALDIALDDRFKAASTVRRVSMRLARAIEAGKFTVRRGGRGV